MGRKKLAWFLIVTFMAYINYGTKLCLAAESEDSLKIKITVENFLNGYASHDLDSMMAEVSHNYLEQKGNDLVDYAKFKARVEKIMGNIYKKFNKYVISEVSLSNLNIQSDKADAEVEYGWKGTDINTSEEKTGKNRRAISLVKEEDTWKIVQFKK